MTIAPAAPAARSLHMQPAVPASAAPAPAANAAALFTGNRLPAFIGIAQVTGMVARDEMTVSEAITAAGLDFTVTRHEGQANVPLPGGGTLALPQDGYWSTVRNNPDGSHAFLGMVKGRYQTIQNSDAFAFGQHLIDEYGANVAAAASFGKPLGTRTFLALALTETLNVAGQDPHDLYLLIGNSHDGSTGLTAAIVPIRRASMGEVVTNMAHAPQRWTLRHSGDIAGKFAEAVHTMQMVKQWIATYQRMTYNLLGTHMTVSEFEDFARRLLPTPRNAGKRSAETWANRRRVLVDLFENAPTNSFGRGTRYAAFCAVNEYVDHFAATRGGDPTQVRYARNLGGQAVRFKERAWAMLAD